MNKLLHYINLLLNVSTHEWPRIILAWLLKMFTWSSFVMSSTILLAMFIEKYGINNLPVMYIISAFIVVIGSVFFSVLLERIEKKSEIIMLTAAAAILLFASAYLEHYPMLFFGSLFISISVLISQLNILLALFIEEMFSPLESARTFPIIESSEPVGGI